MRSPTLLAFEQALVGIMDPRWIRCLELVRRRELSTAERGSISIVLSTTRQTCLATRSGPKTKTLLP